jgi:hypothetical protein
LKSRVFLALSNGMPFADSENVCPEFAMSVSLSGAFSSSGLSSTPTVSASASKSSGLGVKAPSVVQQFLAYASMTPAERMQADMLSQLGLTEDQFKAMTPAEQQKVEDKIRQMIKQQAEQSNDKRTGLITDISV